MFHVLCTLPNASTNINGITFKPHPKNGVMTVDPVDLEVAMQFDGIPGYELIEVQPEQTDLLQPADGPDKPAKSSKVK
jgi:hypothetical protein